MSHHASCLLTFSIDVQFSSCWWTPGTSCTSNSTAIQSYLSVQSSCCEGTTSWLDARLRSYCDLQQLAERHVGLMSELERRMEEERDALRREAAAMAASAAAAGEDRARTALSARSDCHPYLLPWPLNCSPSQLLSTSCTTCFMRNQEVCPGLFWHVWKCELMIGQSHLSTWSCYSFQQAQQSKLMKSLGAHSSLACFIHSKIC